MAQSLNLVSTVLKRFNMKIQISALKKKLDLACLGLVSDEVTPRSEDGI